MTNPEIKSKKLTLEEAKRVIEEFDSKREIYEEKRLSKVTTWLSVFRNNEAEDYSLAWSEIFLDELKEYKVALEVAWSDTWTSESNEILEVVSWEKVPWKYDTVIAKIQAILDKRETEESLMKVITNPNKVFSRPDNSKLFLWYSVAE